MRRNRIPFVVAGVLIVLLGGGVIVTKSSKKKSGPTVPPETARALSVPANVPRTVVVAPCNTPVQQTKGGGTPGSTALELPAGGGTRYVLVPHCLPKAGVTESPGAIPSAAFVLASGDRPAEGQGGSLVKRLGDNAPGSKATPGPKDPAYVARTCAKCSTANDPDAKFCKSCGAQL